MASGLEDLLTGRTLVKRYTIKEVIGRGGFAVVYCADDLRLGRPSAVKVLSIPAPTPELREHMRARFEREARAAAALPHHPNVVPVYDFGTDPETGIDFIVMELLRGENVAAYLAREGRPPIPLALRILRDAAEGIAVGHRAGLIHRDIKPANLFLTEAQGEQPFRVCVLDFGIARLTADDDDGSMTRTRGAAPLSPAYASPEQLRGDLTITPATDVYALGVVGYQLLTGKKPFGAERDAGAPALQPVTELNPQVSPGLAAVIERAMLPEPEARYASAGEFAAALDASADADDSGTLIATSAPPIMDDDERTVIAPVRSAAPPVVASLPVQHAPPPAAPPPPYTHTPPPPRRKRSAWLLALPILLLGLVAGLWAMNQGGGDVDRSPGVPADSVNTRAEDPVEEPLPLDPGVTLPPTGTAEDPGGGEPVQVSPTPVNPDGGGYPPVYTQPAPQAPARPGEVAPQPQPRPDLPPRREAPRQPLPQQQQPQPQPQPQPLPPQPLPPLPQPVPPQPEPQPPPPTPYPVPRDTIVLPPAPPPPVLPGTETMGGSGSAPGGPS